MPQLASRKHPRFLKDKFNLKLLLSGLTAGVILGITEVIFAISLGSLVFSGELTPFLPRGIGIALFSAAVMMFVTALFSKVPGVFGSVQDTSTVILAAMAAGLVSAVSGVALEERLSTIVVAIAAASLLTGVFFILLGSFKLGGLVRYIPYPVIGGFLAGTGWLLAQGSFGVMTQYSLNLGNIYQLLQPGQVVLWVPGLIFALILFIALRRSSHVLVLPGILVAGVSLCYLVFWLAGISVEEAIQEGLLLGPLASGARWQPVLPVDILTANWAAILGQGGNIAIILILSMVGLLLNASALEIAIHGDIDINRELQAAGVANFVSGLGGGMAGYHGLSLSALSYRMGARGRLPGLVAGILCAAVLISGTTWLAYFPKPVLGGLLLFVGLDFLFEWVVVSWKKLPRQDYAVVVLILAVIVSTNFLIGVAAGLVACIILFVLNYSRINVVSHAFSGAELHSNVERCTYHRRALADLGKQVYILELQGFIFFGTANSILEMVRARLADPAQTKVRYLVLDFRRVSGVDSSAGLSFNKSRQLADAQGIILLLTHVSDKVRRSLGLESLPEKAGRIFPDLDSGLEWCEEQLLEINQVTGLHTPVALVAQLADGGFEKNNTSRLKEFLECVSFKKGDYLVRQGNNADALFFIELGSVSVFLEMGNGERLRLQTYGLGTAVGEMDLYQGTTCTASVVADSAVTAYRLTRERLCEMNAREPKLAAAFHEFIAHLLSERLAATTRTLEAAIR